MLRIGLILLALSFAAPAAAQERAEDGIGLGQLLELFRDEAEGVLRNLMDEADESRKELERRLRDMEPRLRALTEDLAREFGGLWQYHPPEVLPNGDIILRRRRDGDAADSSPDQARPDAPDQAPDTHDDGDVPGDGVTPESEPFEL